MISGAHVILYSADADADRKFLDDLLDGPSVDAGGGWLIMALPPAEVAVHPAEGPSSHELYLMCDDLDSTLSDLSKQGVGFDPDISEERWGRLTRLHLPSGATVGLYEPRHPVAAGQI